MTNVYNDLLIKINEKQIYLNEPMKKHTTFKIGGPADIFVKVKTIQELKYVIDVAKKENAPVTVIGNGSNILVKDGGIRGIVVKPEFKEIEFIDEETIRVGAGVLLSKIANVAYEHELTGLEFAAGIPGTMGGAVRMNAGAYGKEIKSVIYSTTYIDKNSEVKIANKLEHEFDYRKSRFAKNKDEIIVESIIKLEKGNKAEIKQKMDDDKKSRKLCKFYGAGENQVKAVNQVDIQIEQGEFVAIVGKSGSGKSTLLHMLGGLDTPTKGSVTLAGKDLYRMKEDALAVFRRRKIGFVFQAFNLVSSVNVWENIVLPLGLDGRKVDEAYVNDIIATLGIENRIYNLPNQLSGGQQQRVAIARALVNRPEIIFADEPTGNLDSKTSDEVIALLKMTAKKYGQTIVMITHDDEIAQVADRILVIEDGQVVDFR